MTTIEFTVDETLLTELDRATRSLAMSRASFIRAALELALRNQHTLALEKQHAQGYKKHPMKSSEIGEWESKQVWGDRKSMMKLDDWWKSIANSRRTPDIKRRGKNEHDRDSQNCG